MTLSPQNDDFDPEFSPEHPHNMEAAERHHLRWNAERRMYEDEDGCLVRDEYGQPL